MALLQTSPETYEHIIGLRVVRAYAPDSLEPGTLQEILEAARWTGSSKNVQGWEFIVVDEERLAELASAGNFTDPVRNSAATVALVQTPQGNPFDIGRAAQNIMLAAAALGVGSCPVTLHNTERAVEVLGLPDGFSSRWAVALGYPFEEGEQRLRTARQAGGVGGRKRLDNLIHHQRYGS